MDDSALLCVNTPYQRKDTVFPSVLHLVDNTKQSGRFSVWTVRSLDLFFLGVLPLLFLPAQSQSSHRHQDVRHPDCRRIVRESPTRYQGSVQLNVAGAPRHSDCSICMAQLLFSRQTQPPDCVVADVAANVGGVRMCRLVVLITI